MNANHWQVVTIPANTPERGEQVEFRLDTADREEAARIQAALVTHRNEPQKRRPA